MFNISDYLKKFARFEGDSLLQKDAVSTALKEVCGIENVSFEVKKGILMIKGSPVMKSLVFTKKAALIAALQMKYPQGRIFDVR